MLKKREGFSSFECLIVLVVLCIILIAFCFFIKTVNISVSKKILSINEKKKIDVILDSIYEDIKNDVLLFTLNNKLVVTGGSDYHGPETRDSLGSVYLEDKYVFNFLNKINKRK